MRLLSFLTETFTDAIKALTSKEGLKGLYGVSLCRNAVYLMLSSVITSLLYSVSLYYGIIGCQQQAFQRRNSAFSWLSNFNRLHLQI